ncbi:MAG: EamA family transporter [Patescibacteria group bacterium]|nr:EamA family transporter [Patescibacteria group bacterium]
MSEFRLERRSVIGAGAIMLAAFFWSLDGVFIRPKFYSLPAGLVVFLEHFLGFLILAPFLFFGWSKVKMLRKKDWGAIFWVSIFGGLLGTLMITKAFFAAVGGEVTFATVVILQKLQPVFALIMARLILGEKLSRRFYFWAVAAIVSAYFLAFGKTGLSPGELDFFHQAAWFALLAAFAFGSSTVFGKRIVNHLDFKSTAALRFGLTSLLAFLLIFFNGDLFKIGEVGALYWKLLGVIVFTSGAGAMFIYYFGLKRITASAAAICELFWPLSAVLLDYLLNKNILNNIQIIASAFLLLAFFMVVRESGRKIQFEARVIRGMGRGGKIGLPTINLDRVNLDMDHGVYSVEAEIDGAFHKGLLHFGPKETFGEAASLELFIKEYILNIMEKNVKIKVGYKIREIRKFSGPNELKEQINKDLEELSPSRRL